jgi:hypothetical protein
MASVIELLTNMDEMVDRELAEETKELRENMPQCHFVHHKSHITSPGI